ncbi:MAG: hypothetical protein KJO55_09925 [Gammaproteobacteria bacterium]|nr:hypothetical protein [Gammaproteobacteria bacterium]
MTESMRAVGPLPGHGFVRVTGADATDFLQSMFSADIAALSPGSSVLTGWHDARGRVQACVRVAERDGEFWLVLPAPLSAGLCDGLSRYILRSKVKLQPAGETLMAAGVVVAGGRYEIYAERASLQARLEQHYADGVPRLDDATWELGDIRDGLPAVYNETSGSFTAQMLNLDRIGGVSFTKGCYPGQEIIARTHHLGTPKRRMMRFVSTAGEIPTAGSKLLDDSGKAAGVVVRAAAATDSRECLVVTQVNRTTPLFDTDETAWRPATLPYSLS